jgi:hypothetical protein
MATGRTLDKYKRIYIDGYDMSGNARSVGPLDLMYDEADLTAWPDTVHGYMRNHANVNLGTFNANFDNTATVGVHAVLGTAGIQRTVIVAQGIRAAPAAGDPVFAGQFQHSAYQITENGGALTASIPFAGWSVLASSLLYASPWGVLLHASSAETDVNSANSGISNPTGGATTKGGIFVYQVLAGDGTATLSVDDSANNSAWQALSGATTGSIDCSTVKAGIVALGIGATVRQYLRWQLALGTANSVTFVTAFCRAF